MSNIIPCIDLMRGKAVQLQQGRTKLLEWEPEEALTRFEGFPLLHVIDLDAALGQGNNRSVVRRLLTRVRARVGGGVRGPEQVKELIGWGAESVIVGSAAFSRTGVDLEFLSRLDRSEVTIAIDVKEGRIAVKGWTETVPLSPFDVVRVLEPYCAGFLCTCVDREGMLSGTDLEFFLQLRQSTDHALTAAGGITTIHEIRTLIDHGIQVALGMSVYSGRLDLAELQALQGSSIIAGAEPRSKPPNA